MFYSILCTHILWKQLSTHRSVKVIILSFCLICQWSSYDGLNVPRCSIHHLIPRLFSSCWLGSSTLVPCYSLIIPTTILHFCPLSYKHPCPRFLPGPGLPWLSNIHGTYIIHSLSSHFYLFYTPYHQLAYER